MKTYEEIKDIIVNKLGIKDLEAYVKWEAQFHESDHTKRRIVTQEDVELLSPDRIDNNAFWRVAEELFGADPVANCNYGKLPNDVVKGNLRNVSLARSTGALTYVDEWKHFDIAVLEIGAGYGSFRDYCAYHTNFRYLGVDVYPRIANAIPTNPDGTLPAKLLEDTAGKAQIVYSSNVFQHLSNRQRSQYFKDVLTLMKEDGLFVFNLLVHFDDPASCLPERTYAWDKRRYLHHYGQMTEIPYYPELREELEKNFKIFMETRRYHDYFFTFHCTKKPVPVLTEEQTPAKVAS